MVVAHSMCAEEMAKQPEGAMHRWPLTALGIASHPKTAGVAARNILIEDKASGTQLAQELIREGMHGIHKCHSTQQKSMRMLSATSTIENGFVYLPEKAHWQAQYLHELTTSQNGNTTTRPAHPGAPARAHWPSSIMPPLRIPGGTYGHGVCFHRDQRRRIHCAAQRRS